MQRITDGGVTVDDCRGCGQETIYVGGLCSDCQVDVQMGLPAGTFYREEQARDEAEAVARVLTGPTTEETRTDG